MQYDETTLTECLERVNNLLESAIAEYGEYGDQILFGEIIGLRSALWELERECDV